jgi:hypothetical protein
MQEAGGIDVIDVFTTRAIATVSPGCRIYADM